MLFIQSDLQMRTIDAINQQKIQVLTNVHLSMLHFNKSNKLFITYDTFLSLNNKPNLTISHERISLTGKLWWIQQNGLYQITLKKTSV